LGDYARIYDTAAVKRCLFKEIDLNNFEIEIVKIQICGQSTPNKHLLSHLEITAINLPYRALVLKRTA